MRYGSLEHCLTKSKLDSLLFETKQKRKKRLLWLHTELLRKPTKHQKRKWKKRKISEKYILNKKLTKMKDKLKIFTFEQIKNEFIGENGTEKRNLYEQTLQLEVLGDLIKKVRLERNLTQ